MPHDHDDHEEGEDALCLCCLTRLCAYTELSFGGLLDLHEVATQAIQTARLESIEDRNEVMLATLKVLAQIGHLGVEGALDDALNLGLDEELIPPLRARLEQAKADTDALRAAA